MFRGDDNADQVVKIARVLGTEGLYKYLDKYELQMYPQVCVYVRVVGWVYKTTYCVCMYT